LNVDVAQLLPAQALKYNAACAALFSPYRNPGWNVRLTVSGSVRHVCKAMDVETTRSEWGPGVSD